jgi:hypothetical protein
LRGLLILLRKSRSVHLPQYVKSARDRAANMPFIQRLMTIDLEPKGHYDVINGPSDVGAVPTSDHRASSDGVRTGNVNNGASYPVCTSPIAAGSGSSEEERARTNCQTCIPRQQLPREILHLIQFCRTLAHLAVQADDLFGQLLTECRQVMVRTERLKVRLKDGGLAERVTGLNAKTNRRRK